MHHTRGTTAFLILSFLFALACGARGPGATVRQFYGYLQAEKPEKALELVSNQIVGTLGREKLLTALAANGQEIRSKGGIRSIEIENEKIEGDTAELTAIVTFGNEEVSTDAMRLIREDGVWKLAPSK